MEGWKQKSELTGVSVSTVGGSAGSGCPLLRRRNTENPSNSRSTKRRFSFSPKMALIDVLYMQKLDCINHIIPQKGIHSCSIYYASPSAVWRSTPGLASTETTRGGGRVSWGPYGITGKTVHNSTRGGGGGIFILWMYKSNMSCSSSYMTKKAVR